MSIAYAAAARTEQDETSAPGTAHTPGDDGPSRRRGLAARLSVPALVLLVQGLLTGSTLLQVREGLGARNLEASYHAILTAKALLANPLSRHWGLPTVTLGQDNDKYVLWGATVATDSGDYIYTSFPPAGFWLPAIAGFLRGGDIGLAGLVAINGVLAATAGVLLYLLVVRAVRRLDRPEWAARTAGLVAAVVYLTSTEALQSHGAVYWPHAMLQPLLLGLLLVLDHLLTRPEGADRRGLLLGLGVLTAIACYTEWTAYVFAFLTGAAILLVPSLRRRIGAAGVVLVSVAVVTAAVLAAHYVAVLGADAAVEAWKARFLARSGGATDTTLLDLQYGYALSFGGALFAVLVLVALAAFRPEHPGRRDAVGGIIVLFALTAVLENLLLRQHAVEFTFDRLKLGIPLALVAGLAVGHLSRRLLVVAGVVVAVGAAVGVSAHRTDVDAYAGWPYVDDANRALVAQAKQAIDLDCATLGTNTQVRGYTNLVLGRAVTEFVEKPESMQGLAADDAGSCGTVYIRGRSAFTDLPQFLSITIVQPDGGQQVLEPR
ncbi:MAG: hypothetical protein JHC71_01275 [Blastococcus sp.]|nr:hypothetical protein [Blastococcus sp.]